MEQYLKTMKKYEPQWTYNDLAFEGYLNAVQFVQGLKEEAATGKPLTQADLIATINKEKAFTGGLTTPVNWSTAHDSPGTILCAARWSRSSGVMSSRSSTSRRTTRSSPA